MSKPLPPNTFFWSNTSPYHDLWEICTLHLKPNLIPRLLFISSMNFISCKCLGSLLPTSKVCWTPKLTLQIWGHLLLPDSINHNQHNHRSIWTENTIRGKHFSETLEYLTKSWRGNYYNHTSQVLLLRSWQSSPLRLLAFFCAFVGAHLLMCCEGNLTNWLRFVVFPCLFKALQYQHKPHWNWGEKATNVDLSLKFNTVLIKELLALALDNSWHEIILQRVWIRLY